MRTHIEKAQHNENFLSFIEKNTVELFIDWQITVVFYAGLHYMKAYLKFKKAPNTSTHKQIDQLINPQKGTDFQLPEETYICYQQLYQNSRQARYTGNYNTEMQQMLLTYKLRESRESLHQIKEYIKQQGLKF